MKSTLNPAWVSLAALLAFVSPAQPETIDLLQRFPTSLTEGDHAPDHARPWEFTGSDIFALSGFKLELGQDFRVETGPANLGLGHCQDGVVWAVILPKAGGTLVSTANAEPEGVGHIWLRFHPRQISRLFPPATVAGKGASELEAEMRFIAQAKFTSSWHAGMNAMIPDAEVLTVDLDTTNGMRRFFGGNLESAKADYVAAFARRAVKLAPPITEVMAEQAFDKLWEKFDRDYAMFAIRPEVDWEKSRAEYRPKAVKARSAYELAAVFAEMLRPLRDLHIWLKVGEVDVPVFNRPRASNSNPSAHEAILGSLVQNGPVSWSITEDKIGYLAIHGWGQEDIPDICDEIMEELRGTRAMIVDVRLNGGGSEDLAQAVAGRFVTNEFTYGFSQFRTGPKHTDLSEKQPRSVSPRGSWQYAHDVVLLIGQKCMSSNESFIAMMSGAPQVILMGDHTCGSSGNPEMLKLPGDITVSVPRWIDFRPDGQPLDEKGIEPKIVFRPAPGAFEGQHDDLLKAALERLRR